jgi:glyoxylase-like metal-dependent hydrolase (beta-lactamase superfamily II)
MKKWNITAIDVGTLEFERSIGTYLTNCGQITRIHSIAFLIREVKGSRSVIIDTGFESVERTMEVHGQRVWRKKDQYLHKQLADMSINPSDIEIGILTHLHYDHSGNNRLFPNAKFYVQRKELQYAFAPLPGEETAYFSPLIGVEPSFLGTRFEIIEGDWEICEGIRVIAAPGHTPGSQMVLVDTENGVYCLTGDNAFYYENIEKNLPVGHLYSRADWFSSIMRARQLADHFIPSHDPEIFTKKPAVFP